MLRSSMPLYAATAVLCLALAGPAAAQAPWPGGNAVSTVDVAKALGDDVSGLYYQNSGTAAPGVMWTVDNGNSRMDRLVFNGAAWVKDTTNGWSAGKTLRFTDGLGRPDSEGVTMTDAGEAGGVFVSSESNLDVVASRNSILRYDVSGAGTTLTATQEWNLTADLPVVGRNSGAESVEWVPDAYLTGAGFIDQNTGLPYDPTDYPNHGSGLFFVGIEANGNLYAYALDQTSSGFTRIATFASGFATFGALHWDQNERQLWVVCDNNCNGRSRVFEVDGAGAFALVAEYERPTGMANLNNEGFTFPNNAQCLAGSKPVFWADDGNADDHVLRSAAIPCTPPKNDLLVDFPTLSLYQRMNNVGWLKVHSGSPVAVGSGDLDDSGKDEAIVTFAGGLYARYDNAAPWVKLHNSVPTRFATGDADGVAGEDLVAHFNGTGVWIRYNNAVWTRVHSSPSEDLATGDLDGNGQADVLSDFGASGLRVRMNNANPWIKINAASPVHLAVGDIDGGGKDDVVADLGASGLWVWYNNAVWTKINNAGSEGLAIGDLDGNGQAEILADFGASGVMAFFNNTSWISIHPSSPIRMATADMDGSGKDEAVLDLGASGIWVRYNNNPTLVKLHARTSEGIASGGFD
jgi:hypothetical protein